MKTKVFAYLRVSSSQQAGDDKDGLIRQEKACQDYASKHDMEIVQVYQEAITGTKFDRPVLAELIVSLEKNHHGVRTVIIERLDRLARDIIIQERIIRGFRELGCHLISTLEAEGEDLCEDDPTRDMIRQICSVFAQYDKKMLVAKLRASRERMKQKTGKCEGRKGYDESEEGQRIIQYIKLLHKKPKHYRRLTLEQIADKLNKEGIKTLEGKEWSLYRVQNVLKSY